MTTDHQPVAEVSHGRLHWHLPTPDADPAGRFLDNDTHLLYDQAALDAAVAAERERICAAIKAEDDYMADRDYMLDSDDCIKVARGQWERPE